MADPVLVSDRVVPYDRGTLDEWIDLVPLNKIQAFGGDCDRPVENVYGHLRPARGVVAEVLSKRVKKGETGEEQVVETARMWFHDNSRRLYRLEDT